MVHVSETLNEAEGPPTPEEKLSQKREANWPAVLFFIHILLLPLYGIWLMFLDVKVQTILFLIVLVSVGILGVTTGAHRLWAHGAYKATTGLRIFLMMCQTLAGQGPIYDWVRYHRLHHMQFGTDADPFDYNRGFLYAQIFTRLNKLSDYQIKLLNEVDMSDLEKDSVVMFQKNAYWLLYGVFFLLLPLNAPLEYWNDTILNALFVIGFLRYAVVLHGAWLMESGICVWGLKRGQKYPHDSNSVFILNRTFWPHYHYLIPYDYKSGEFGTYDSGCSTAFIRIWAALGLATDLRTVETPTVQKALADAANSTKPITQCFNDATSKQILADEHYLKRG